MQITLFDRNPEMYDAWRMAFNGIPDVAIINTSLDKLPEHDCLVTAGNSFGAMSGGIDLGVRDYFGYEMQALIQLEIMRLFPAVTKPKSFRVEEYAKSVFSMYDEENHILTLKCENSLMKSIVDRFGDRVKTTIVDDEHFIAEVEVSVSPTFFGWAVGFGGRMSIVAPDDIVGQYIGLLQGIVEEGC